MTEFSDLSPAQKARRYRALETEALQSAGTAKTQDERNYFLRMAAQWKTLAVHFEALVDREP